MLTAGDPLVTIHKAHKHTVLCILTKVLGLEDTDLVVAGLLGGAGCTRIEDILSLQDTDIDLLKDSDNKAVPPA